MTTDTRDEEAETGSNADVTSPVRYPTAMAIGGGLAAAVGSSFIPMNAIEGFVSAYGIAELLPAAAPPLGNTARLALSAGIGTLTAGALLALLPRGEIDTMAYETAAKNDSSAIASGREISDEDGARAATGFAGTKLAGWLRTLRFGKHEPAEGEITDFAELDRLRIRDVDQHPDAPVRAPIRASSDLGAPLDAPLATATVQAFNDAATRITESAPLSLDASMAFAAPETGGPEYHEPEPRTPAPSLRFGPQHEDQGIEPAYVDGTSEPFTYRAEPVVPPPFHDAADPRDLAQLGIPALLDRLESGLARRREQALASSPEKTADASPVGRIIPLGIAGATAPGNATPSLRFGLGAPQLEGSPTSTGFDARATPVPTEISYDSTEYTPFVDTAATASDQTAVAETPDLADQVHAAPASSAPVGPADDDMDAALRDALATLRQLSDRQRNI